MNLSTPSCLSSAFLRWITWSNPGSRGLMLERWKQKGHQFCPCLGECTLRVFSLTVASGVIGLNSDSLARGRCCEVMGWKCFFKLWVTVPIWWMIINIEHGVLLIQNLGLAWSRSMTSIEKRGQLCIEDISHSPLVWKCPPKDRHPALLINDRRNNYDTLWLPNAFDLQNAHRQMISFDVWDLVMSDGLKLWIFQCRMSDTSITLLLGNVMPPPCLPLPPTQLPTSSLLMLFCSKITSSSYLLMTICF
jgi:hypothetical protein